MKGYMLILEVAVSLVLLFSLSSFFYARMLEKEEYIPNLEEIGGKALATLEEKGILKEKVYSNNFTSLNSSLRSVLPVSVNYNFFVYNSTSLVGNIVNGNPSGTTANVNWFLYGNESYDPRKIELILWYKW
jgi:hypothetical protein